MMRTVWFLLLLLPMASAAPGIAPVEGPSPATLWVHLNSFQDAPMNTQVPPAWHVEDRDIGLVQHSQGCYAVPATHLLSETHHTTYAYLYPGAVHYVAPGEDEVAGPRFSNGYGLGYDLRLDENSTPVVHWSLRTQTSSASEVPGEEAPIVVPRVVLRATLREGTDFALDRSGFEAGERIAVGQTEPMELHPMLIDRHPEATYHQVDGLHVYDIQVPLQLEQTVVRADEGLNLRIDVIMDNPVCAAPEDDAYLMPDLVRHHSSDGHRPHIQLSILEPVRLRSLTPQFVGSDVVIHAQAESVWGSYDVVSWDERGAARSPPEALLRGADGTTPLELVAETLPGYHVHGPIRPSEQAAFAWIWRNAQSEAGPSGYTVDVTIPNDQATAAARGTAGFDVGAQTLTACQLTEAGSVCMSSARPLDEQATPGPTVVLLVAALLLLTRRLT